MKLLIALFLLFPARIFAQEPMNSIVLDLDVSSSEIEEETPDWDLGGARDTFYRFKISSTSGVTVSAECGTNLKGRETCGELKESLKRHFEEHPSSILASYQMLYNSCAADATGFQWLQIFMPSSFPFNQLEYYGLRDCRW